MRQLSANFNTTLPSESTLRQLNARFSGRRVFPNLLGLDLSNIGDGGKLLQILRLVVSPSLTNCNISIEEASHTQTVLSALAAAYSSLRSIHIGRNVSQFGQGFSTLLLKCIPHQLYEFCVDAPISSAAFLRASQLPNLRFFIVNAIQLNPSEVHSSAPLPSTIFPSLQHLGVRDLCTDSIWLRSLGRICSKNLKTLDLELTDIAAAKAALHLRALRDLPSCELHRTLTILCIGCNGHFSGLEVDGMTVEHLLPFTQLTSLDISFTCSQDKCGYKLSDKDLERLVKAMPKLVDLTLGRKLCSIPANHSIESLMAIAKHSKHMESLHIHTNAETIIAGSPFGSGYPRGGPTLQDQALVGCPLRSITFGPCRIPNGEQGIREFTSILHWLFPGLRSVCSSYSDPQWDSLCNFVFRGCVESAQFW